MNTDWIAGSTSSASRSRWLLLPEYGLVEAILGFGLFYLLVSIATDPFSSGFSRVLGVTPRLIRLGLAISLWGMLGLIVLTQVGRQLQANPHRFKTEQERRAFLDQVSPGVAHYLKAFLAGLLGGMLLWALWTEFLVAFGRFMVMVIDPVRLTSMSVESVLIVTSFFIGFGLFSYGIDRLVIGLGRNLIAVTVIETESHESPA